MTGNRKCSQIIYKIFVRVQKKLALWQKKQNLISIHNQASPNSIGQKFNIGYNLRISGLKNVVIGNNVYIGSGTFIRAEGGLTLGSNVIISRNVVIYTINHNYQGELLPYDSSMIKKPVAIEDNVWVGMNVTIAPGSYIGEGSIIGLGARIYGQIPKYSIVGSNGEIIKKRNKQHYQDLKSKKKFADDDGNEVNYE